MAIWQSEWWALRDAPLVTEIFMNWDDDDRDGQYYTPWWSYVVYPPFDPNAKTIEAMEAADRGELVDVGDIDGLFADLAV